MIYSVLIKYWKRSWTPDFKSVLFLKESCSLLLSLGRTISSGRAVDNRTCVAIMSTTVVCIKNIHLLIN